MTDNAGRGVGTGLAEHDEGRMDEDNGGPHWSSVARWALGIAGVLLSALLGLALQIGWWEHLNAMEIRERQIRLEAAQQVEAAEWRRQLAEAKLSWEIRWREAGK